MRDVIPVPRTIGVFVLILTLLAFTAGGIRNELALILMGAVFLSVLGYCFIVSFLLACIHRKRILGLSARIITTQVTAGAEGGCAFTLDRLGEAGKNSSFFRLPGILFRYEIRLATKDGRRLGYLFDPDCLKTETGVFTVLKRGAYYTSYDEVTLFDAPGFFRMTFRIPQDEGPRLLAMPDRTGETLQGTIHAGGLTPLRDLRLKLADTLTDHRPYTPGDDPRRINWKLYGHAGDLFIREGQPEPPPHSRLLIIIDAQTDPALYTLKSGRRGVDALCEHALGLTARYSEQGVDIGLGYAGGGGVTWGTPRELAAALAYPAARALSVQEELPYSPEDQGALILALPRSPVPETTALDRFLAKRKSHQTAALIFLYRGGPALDRAAEICAAVYNRQTGVSARGVKLESL
jgi:uncharacterized protein (DUF58 family)